MVEESLMPFVSDGRLISHSDFQILLLDDDASEGELLAGALRAARPEATVYTVSSPETALRYLYKDREFSRHHTPDLVFIDYRMPSNGGRVLSAMKGDPDLRSIPVVVLSRNASGADIAEIYDRQANCCIDKPVNAGDLTADIRGALAFWMNVAVVRRNRTLTAIAR
jgi:CheY-like chemotaxis protein